MSDAYILGTDMIKFGRFPERTVPKLGAEAALLALDDAGLGIHDMEALYCGNLMQAGAMVGQRLLQGFALQMVEADFAHWARFGGFSSRNCRRPAGPANGRRTRCRPWARSA